MIGGSISGGRAPLPPLASGRPAWMLTSPPHTWSGDHGVPLMLSLHRITLTGFQCADGRRMNCSPSGSHSRTLRQSLLVGQEQEVRTGLSRQAHAQDADPPLSFSVGVLQSAPTMYLFHKTAHLCCKVFSAPSRDRRSFFSSPTGMSIR